MNSPKSPFNLILTDGGVGDLLCELVAVDYNIRNFPHMCFNVWVPDYLCDFAKHVLAPGAIIRPFSQSEAKFNNKIQGLTTQWVSFHTAMKTHPVDYGFHMLSDRHVYDLNKKNYLQIRPNEIKLKKFFLPDTYICLVSTGTEPVKTMSPETLSTIADYVKSKGYTPVFMGSESSKCGYKDFAVKSSIIPIDYSKGINLINKTSLLEAAGIIAGAKAIVGMDGGLIHLAGFTDTEIISGYTLVSPEHIAPIRHGSQTHKFQAVEPDPEIPNRYYQTYAGFKEEDCRVFPGWEKVMGNLTADKFIAKLENVLGR